MLNFYTEFLVLLNVNLGGEFFIYVFLGMLTYIWMPARLTREIKKKDDPVNAECPAVEDSCGDSRDDLLGGVKSSCFTPST